MYFYTSFITWQYFIFGKLFQCITFLLTLFEMYIIHIYTLILVTVSFKTNDNGNYQIYTLL